MEIPEKASDHEEADMKLVALVENADIGKSNSVMGRYPSKDIDILVLFLLHQFDEKVFIDNGDGKNRKLSTSLLTPQQRQTQTLAGMHGFSGNDCVKFFLEKESKEFGLWYLLESGKFLQTFSGFGLFGYTTDELIIALEEFTCHLYGDKNISKVNELRRKIFEMKSKGKGKNVDLINLPACLVNLSLHIDRACYVANIFYESRCLMMLLDDPINQ